MGKCKVSGGIFVIEGVRLEGTGVPNSRFDLYKNGELDSWRWYDADGRATRNRNFNDHGNPKAHPVVPHDHIWDYSKEHPRSRDWTKPDPNCC